MIDAPTFAPELDEILDRPFYSPAEVAEIAAVSHSTILNYIRDGRLVAVRLSERVIRIPRRSVLKFLAPDSVTEPRRVPLDEIALRSA